MCFTVKPLLSGQLLKSRNYCQYNNYGLFLRLFEIKKSGAFLFEISSFVLEIFMFLYNVNHESDDVINRSIKR